MWITKRCTADSLYCSVNPMCINKWVIVVFAGIDGGQRSRHRWQFLSFSSCIVIMLVKRLTIDITLYSRILQYSRNLLAYQTRTFLSILFFLILSMEFYVEVIFFQFFFLREFLSHFFFVLFSYAASFTASFETIATMFFCLLIACATPTFF